MMQARYCVDGGVRRPNVFLDGREANGGIAGFEGRWLLPERVQWRRWGRLGIVLSVAKAKLMSRG